MIGHVAARLTELGLELPPAPKAVANYVPYKLIGYKLYVSGQIPMDTRTDPPVLVFTGRLGHDIDIEAGQAAARLCALNMLAQVQAALGSLDRIAEVVRLGGLVAATPEFRDHPKVLNGASDLMVDVFGEAGRHTRFALGAASLPGGAAVEVDGLFALRD